MAVLRFLASSGSQAGVIESPKFAAGSYTWRAKARAAVGQAESGWFSPSRTFTVQAPPPGNQPPATLTLVSPADGATFEHGAAQEFVARATDPEGDDYFADFEVRNDQGLVVTTFSSAAAGSGSDASASPPVTLPAGEYTWRARARGVNSSGTSAYSTSRSFTVAEAPPNRRPDAPELVSPSDGHAFAPGAEQRFTLRAEDPDGDLYHAQITIETASGTFVRSVDTLPTTSGSEVSVVLDQPLPAGSYRWSAVAVDDAGTGAASDRSAIWYFTVS